MKIFKTAAAAIALAALSPAAIAALAYEGSVEVNDQAFAAKGFAEGVFTVKVTRDGKPEPGVKVRWRVLKSENRGPVAPGWESSWSGLSWFAPVPGGRGNRPEFSGITDKDGVVRAKLYDIVGERRVTVRAAAAGAPGEAGATITVSFGPGPLSRFAKPEKELLSWTAFRERIRQSAGGAAPESFIPTEEELQTVSLPGPFNKNPAALGAALAAGWAIDFRYLANPGPGAGRARHLDLATGNPHGFGGVAFDVPQRAVRLKSPRK